MSEPMLWVFAILIVLAMGGIAMVAAGRGAPMPPAYDDRPDALVPADRPIGAQDLRNVGFSLAFRGYRMNEVDALLARLAREMEQPAEEPNPGSRVWPGEPEPGRAERESGPAEPTTDAALDDAIGDNDHSVSMERGVMNEEGVPNGGDEASDR